jgi:GH25 family lysozyme M1 (1,4-beta-N-acetylmuramidase)
MAADVLGIDVSEFQGVIEWPTVQHATVSGTPLQVAVARATYGATYTDRQWAHNWPALRGGPLIRGPYHFAVPSGTTPASTAASAQQQAHFFLATLDAAEGWQAEDLPPVLDLEVANGLSAVQLVDWAGQWGIVVRSALGLSRLWVYSDQAFYTASLIGLGSTWDRWVAAYPGPVTVAHQAHQYTDAGTVAGITGHVDLSRWDVAALPTAVAPAAPPITWTPRPGGIAWRFTPPAPATGYTGWAQGTDAPGETLHTAPTFTDAGGYWQWRWTPPGATHLVLRFFYGARWVDVTYALPTVSAAVVRAAAAIAADVAALRQHTAELQAAVSGAV